MFFRLVYSLAMFQIMMNEILWDLINTGEIASFIGDIIVGTEEEKEHDEVIEEVIKRFTMNDLYVKPEKYKWNIKKIEFLGVVIRLERIKMEKEMVKEVLDWLIPKGVKNIQKLLELANYYQWFIKYFTLIARLLHNLMKN